jgi:hypothetical protein
VQDLGDRTSGEDIMVKVGVKVVHQQHHILHEQLRSIWRKHLRDIAIRK